MGPVVFLQICVLLRDRDAHRRRVRRGVPELRAPRSSCTSRCRSRSGALGAIPLFNDAAGWIDTTQTTEPLTEGVASGIEWARFWVSMGVWMILPLAIGLYRIAKGEIRAA